jgi:hypothetical protein
VRPARIPPQAREALDALVTDAYLDSLLAGGEAAPPGRPPVDRLPTAQDEDAGADRQAAKPAPGLRHAGDVLSASLVRVHPSFRFEERLAAQLADLAAANASRSMAVGGSRGADVIPFPGAIATAEDPLLQAVLDGRLDPTDAAAVARAVTGRSPAMPLIVGGAVTSAAISLVGVAWVAWRASRTGSAPMARAARAAHARRLSDLAAGVPGGPA